MTLRPFPSALALVFAAICSPASAVDQPSIYPGCASRSVTVPWGGSVEVDLKACHSFGLGVVSQPPAHGKATPGANVPLDAYRYIHGGTTPVGGGRDRFVVRDDNSDTITITVNVAPPASASTLGLAPADLPALQAGKPLALSFSASGGTAPYRYRLVSGALPPGLALSAEGRLAGSPTARVAYAFDLELRDARGATTRRAYGGKVGPAALAISPAAGTAYRGQPFRLALAARGGVAPHRFRLEGGRLPEGLRLSPDGVLSGVTSVSPGRFPLRLRVTDASTGDGDHFELEPFTLQVLAPPAAKRDATP